MSVDLRLMGDPAEVAEVAELLVSVLEGSALEIAGSDRTYPNHRGFGVRVFFEVRSRPSQAEPVAATADRLDRREIAPARPVLRARGDAR